MVPNIPYWDEWDAYISFAHELKKSQSLEAAFALFVAPDDQHRIILPKLLYWIVQYLPGQLKWLMGLTLVLMLGVFTFLWQNYFRSKLDPVKDKYFALALFLFCLSWGQSDVYFMGICISWVISNFCFLLALRAMQKHNYLKMSIYMLINVLSLGTWLLSVPIILLAFTQEYFANQEGRKRLAVGALAYLTASILLYLFYLPHTPSATQNLFVLWRYLGHLMMFWGIPFASPGHKIAFAFGVVFLGAIAWFFSSKKRLAKLQEPLLVLYGFSSGLLISVPRSPNWQWLEAIGNRYSIIMTISWSFILLSIWLTIQSKPRARKFMLLGLAVLLLITYANELAHEISIMKSRKQAGACINRILKQQVRLPDDDACLKAVYPDPERVLEIAKKTKIEF